MIGNDDGVLPSWHRISGLDVADSSYPHVAEDRQTPPGACNRGIDPPEQWPGDRPDQQGEHLDSVGHQDRANQEDAVEQEHDFKGHKGVKKT